MPPDQFIESIWPEIEDLNSRSQPHTRLSKRMLAIGRFEELPLPKSSKGTFLRGEVDKRFHDRIEALYEAAEKGRSRANADEQVPNERVVEVVAEIVQSVIGRAQRIDEEADLFLEGVDSVAAMQIRTLLQEVRCRLECIWTWLIIYPSNCYPRRPFPCP